LKSVPTVDNQNQLLKRAENDEIEIFTPEEKSKYVDSGKFRSNIANSPFSFIHVMWSSIASGFRAIYKISKEDLIEVSETDIENVDASSIFSTMSGIPGLTLLLIVIIIFLITALLVNLVCCPLYTIIVSCCVKTNYKYGTNYRPGKILCGKIYFGVFSFLLTFAPLFGLMGYSTINNSVDIIAKSGRTLISDVDTFIDDTQYFLSNKTAPIIIDTVHEQVLDPIIEDIETDIINPALDIYNNAVDTINTIIPFFGEINDTLNNNGYPIFDDLDKIISDMKTDYPNLEKVNNNDIGKKANEGKEKLVEAQNMINSVSDMVKEAKDELEKNNVNDMYNKAVDTINEAFEMLDSITSTFSNISLDSVKESLNKADETIQDIEGYKKDTDDYHANLGYMALFALVSLFSIVLIIFALTKVHMGVKISLIACIPCGAIFWIITILFIFISVLISQTCNNVYDLDTVTINKIVKNLKIEEGEDLIPFEFEFKTFSSMLKSCANDDSTDISIWKVLDQPEYKDLIKTTCSIIEKYVSSDEIPLNCTTKDGKQIDTKNGLISSFIDSVNITGKVIDEFDNFDLTESLGNINELDIEIQDKYEVENITVEGIAKEFYDKTSEYCQKFGRLFNEPGCTEEKLQDYYDRFLKIETDVSNLNNTIQVEIKDLNTNIIPKVKDIQVDLNNFISTIKTKVDTIIDKAINLIKTKQYTLFESVIDQTFGNATQCQTWSQDVWIISNSVCHGVPGGTDVIWWSAVIIAFLLTFNMCGGIQLMTYTVASRKYNGVDQEASNEKEYEKASNKTTEEKILKSNKDEGGSDGGITKDVIKTNVMNDLNNISKYNADLDNGEETQRTELNNELKDAIKRQSMATPSEQFDALLADGPKSNYVPDTTFNNDDDDDNDRNNNNSSNELNDEDENEGRNNDDNEEEENSDEGNDNDNENENRDEDGESKEEDNGQRGGNESDEDNNQNRVNLGNDEIGESDLSFADCHDEEVRQSGIVNGNNAQSNDNMHDIIDNYDDSDYQ
jgi:hypothetical protein